MKGFTFNFSPVKKKTREKSVITPRREYGKYNILESTVEAVIAIDINANYYAKLIKDNSDLKLVSECFDCTGQKVIYQQDTPKKDKTLKYNRSNSNNLCNVNGYLPFSTGVRVRGNIVEFSGTKYFSPKEYFTKHDYYYDIVFSFYLENYNTINKLIKEKIKNMKWI